MKDFFTILNRDEIDIIDYTLIHDTDENSLRWSLDGTKTFVQYNDKPRFLEDRESIPGEIFGQMLNTPEWEEVEIIIPDEI
jgi:hypothetical protein